MVSLNFTISALCHKKGRKTLYLRKSRADFANDLVLKIIGFTRTTRTPLKGITARRRKRLGSVLVLIKVSNTLLDRFEFVDRVDYKFCVYLWIKSINRSYL